MSIKHLLSNGKKEYMDIGINSINFSNPSNIILENSQKKVYNTTIVSGANSANVVLTAYRLGENINIDLSAFNITTSAGANTFLTTSLDPEFSPNFNSVEFITSMTVGEISPPNATIVIDFNGLISFYRDSTHTPFIVANFGSGGSNINVHFHKGIGL